MWAQIGAVIYDGHGKKRSIKGGGKREMFVLLCTARSTAHIIDKCVLAGECEGVSDTFIDCNDRFADGAFLSFLLMARLRNWSRPPLCPPLCPHIITENGRDRFGFSSFCCKTDL